ncbi:MAG: glycosyltransferase family 4 protein [Clostridiales bacterium]|nr:glycosyltransferase family 4 protein [Clostridiales bacterium]
MKIVVDARTMGTKPSGIGIYAYNFLCGILDRYDVILVTDLATSSEMQHLKERGVKIIEYGKEVYRSSGVFAYFRFIRDILRKEQPELFWEPNILVPISLSGFHGKTVITIHDMFPVTMPQYFGAKYSTYFKFMLKRTLRRTDLILYNSYETKNETEQFFPRAKDVENHVLYIIVPKVSYEGETSDDGYFLYVGNVEKRKGVDILLSAYKKYAEKGGTKKLVIAGKKRGEADVDAALHELTGKYPQQFTYKGYVTDEEKNELYAHAGTVLFQSRAEGFGLCVLEAMHFGKKVLASDLSIFREIVGDVVNYFPLAGGAEALAEAMTKEFAEPDLGKYEEVMSRYYPETLVPRLFEVFDKAGGK